MTKFGAPSIKVEGGIADPDEFTWGCNCKKCKKKYAHWKEKFDEQQEAYMKLAEARRRKMDADDTEAEVMGVPV